MNDFADILSQINDANDKKMAAKRKMAEAMREMDEADMVIAEVTRFLDIVGENLALLDHDIGMFPIGTLWNIGRKAFKFDL